MNRIESNPSQASRLSPEALLGALQAEFTRLNATYFEGQLSCPDIVLSRRKTYGGYYQPKRHRIVMSWQAYQEHGWDETSNTFRHEVAHIVHPNHSKAFWELAVRLGATKRSAAPPIKPRTIHTRCYIYECPVCRRRLHRQRRLRAASCAVCDRKYNPTFALRLVESQP